MSYKKFFGFCFVTLLFCTLSFYACKDNVGLGESVDTEPPTLEILYPPASAVIRGTFALAGSWNDDKGISSIKVTVTNATTNVEEEYKTETVTFTADKDKKWKVNLNAYDADNPSYYNGWELPDGKYVLSVQATDTSGRVSGKITRPVEIDNTIPVVILSSPGSTEAPTPYGSTFNVEGTIADEHAVSKLAITIYDEEGNPVAQTDTLPYTETNVPTVGSTSVRLLKFNTAVTPTSVEGEGIDLTNIRYRDVYGSTNRMDGTHNYQCSLTISDNAKEYTNSDESENTSTGNETTVFYLYDDVYTALMSESKGLGMTTNELMQIINGTYVPSDTDLSARSANVMLGTHNTADVDKAKALLAEKKVDTTKKHLLFSLNPAVNPTYVVNGYALSNGNEAAASQVLTIVINSGRDKAKVLPQYLKAYYKEFDVTMPTADVYAAFVNDPTTGILLADNSSYAASSVDVYTWTVNLPDDLTSGKYYMVACIGDPELGADADGNELVGGDVYGFKCANAGAPPVIEWDENTTEDLSFHNTDALSFSGIAYSPSGAVAQVAYEIKVKNEASGTDAQMPAGYSGLLTLTDTLLDDEAHTSAKAWSFNISDSEGYAAVAEGKQYLYTVTVTVTDGNEATAAITRNIHIDTAKPELEITALNYASTDTVKNNVNGNVTLRASITETNMVEGGVTAIAEGTKDGAPCSVPIENTGSNYSFIGKVDTTYFDDSTEITFTISAEDKAGNKNATSEYKASANDIFTSYTINQSTDKPKFEVTNFTENLALNAIDADHNLFDKTVAGSVVTAQISDDDAVGDVSYNVYKCGQGKDETDPDSYSKENGELISNLSAMVTVNKTPYNLSVQLPLDEGKYRVEIIVSDTLGETEYAISQVLTNMFVAVDEGAPIVSLDKSSGAFVTVNPTLTITAQDSAGIQKIERYTLTQNQNGTYTQAESPDETEITVTSGAYGTSSEELTATNTITADTTGAKRYVVYDHYGRQSSRDFSWKIDKKPPVFTLGTVNGNTFNADDGVVVFNQGNALQITGTVSDTESASLASDASGVKGMYYAIALSEPAKENGSYTLRDGNKNLLSAWTPVSKITRSTAATLSGDTASWSALIDASDFTEGQVYRVYLAAEDNADYISTIDANPSAILTIKPDKTPPVFTLKIGDNVVSETSSEAFIKGTIKVSGTLTEENHDTFKGSATKDGVVQTGLALANGNLTQDQTHTDTYSFAMSDITESGNWMFTFTETDKAGITATRSVSAKIDNTAPQFTPENISDNKFIFETTSGYTPTEAGLSGTYEVVGSWFDTGVGLVDDGLLTAKFYYSTAETAPAAESDDAWTQVTDQDQVKTSTVNVKIPVTQDTKRISFMTEDSLGNKKVYTYAVTVDLAIPVVSFNAPTGPVFDDANGSVTGITNAYYVKASGTAQTVTCTATISDTLKIGDLLKATVTHGSTAYDYEQNGSVVSVSSEKTDDKTTTVTYTLNVPASGNTADGVWYFSLTGKDAAGRDAETLSSASIMVDTKVPDLAITNLDSGAEGAEKLYNEYTVETKDGKYIYTVSGTWRDDTSGTSKLQYKLNDGDWTDVAGTTSAAGVHLGWNAPIEVAEKTGNTITFRAMDACGNTSADLVREKITFDFAIPTVSLTSPESVASYYNAETVSSAQFVITAEDSHGIKEFNVSAKKKGVDTVYTESNDTAGITITPAGLNTTSATVTLSLTGAAADGEWEYITVHAVDLAGRKTATPVTFSTVIDTVAPVIADAVTVGSNNGSVGDWYKNTTLQIKGKIREELSGMETVYFFVQKPTEALPEGFNQADLSTYQLISSVTIAGEKGENVSFSVTPDAFAANVGETANTLYLQAVDKAGNKSAVKTFAIKVDQGNPTFASSFYTYDGISGTPAGGTVLTNGQKDITLYGIFNDAASGVAGLTFKVGDTTITPAISYAEINFADAQQPQFDEYTEATWLPAIGNEDGQIGENKVTAWKAVISKDDIQTGAVKVTASDKAGNMNEVQIFTFNRDDTPPEVTLTAPAYAKSAPYTAINGTVTFRGTATDNQTLSTVKLYYSLDDSTASVTTEGKTNTLIGTLEGSSAYGWSFTQEVTKLVDGQGKMLGLPNNDDKLTNTYTGSAETVYFKLIATDTAANEKVAVYTYSVDPDSDRPLVEMTNLAAKNGVLTTGTIYGTLTDDDGTVLAENFAISEDGDNWQTANATESKLSYTSGSWTFLPTTGDGAKSLYFKIKDTVGTVFVYTGTANNNLNKPKIRGTDYNAGDANTQVDGGSMTYILDTNPPTVNSIKYAYDGNAEEGDRTDLTGISKFGKMHTPLMLWITATDQSGISKISAKFADAEASQDFDSSSNKDESKEAKLTLAVPTSGDYAGTTKEQVPVEITVVDGNKMTTTTTRNVMVDNTPPTLTVDDSIPVDTQITTDCKLFGIASDSFSDGNTVSAGSGIAEVAYYIPTAAEEAGALTDISADKWTVLDGTQNWSINFSGENKLTTKYFHSEETGDADNKIVTYYNTPSKEDTTAYGTSVADGVWKLPIYFRITDNVDNVTYKTDYYVRVNPDGDRPTAKILYPDTPIADGGAVLGGSIRVFGTADDNVYVKSVHMQVQKAEFYTETNGSVVKVHKEDGTEVASKDLLDYETITDMNDITVNGTSSWNYTFNSEDSVFRPFENRQTAIRFRVWAYDNNGLKGAETDWAYITLDDNVPKIGTPILVQYADNDAGTGEITSSLAYETGMYISGTWWLVFSLEDDNGIKTTTTSGGSTKGTRLTSISGDTSYCTIEQDPIDFGSGTPIETGSNANNYLTARIKLVTRQTGSINFTIYAVEDTEKELATPKDIYLRFDNINPEQEELTNGIGGSTIGTGAADNTVKITQSNYSYIISTRVTEVGSGLAYTAMYFKRNSTDDVTRIYDPRFNAASAGRINIGNTAGTDVTINADGLPYKTVTVSDATLNSFTLPQDDSHITVNSLIKVKDVYRTVTAKTGTTITFTPECTEADYTGVDLVYVLLIDNTKTESYDSSTGSVSSDDGDGVYEVVTNEGDYYQLSLRVDSENIPDGPLTVCYVSFDKAKNKSSLSEVATKVENNAPRIARVTLGTDLNGNGEIADNDEQKLTELITYSMMKESNGYKVVENAVLDVTGESAEYSKFTAKAKTIVKPEIVGGNGALHYTWNYQEYSDSTYGAEQEGGALTALSGGEADAATTAVTYFDVDANKDKNLKDGREKNVTSRTGLIDLAVTDDRLGGKVSDGKRKLNFTFWDSTEETRPGTDSLSATVSVELYVDVVDAEPPVAVIDPFYWKSADKNSLFENSTANGHIELEADWLNASGYQDAATTGEYDADPKVSGKISLRGSAYDDVRITALYMAIDDFVFDGAESESQFAFANGNGTPSNASTTYYKVATYNAADSKWSAVDAWNANGWKCTVTPDYLSQDGHRVTWQLDWDSAKLSTVVGTDKQIRIIAVDGRAGGGNASSESSAGSRPDVVAEYNKPSYRVDVVPYVTKVTTALKGKLKTSIKEAYSRTALGHYIARSNEAIEIKGFNLGTADKEVEGTVVTGIKPKYGANELAVGADGTVTLPAEKIATSGKVSLTVSGIETLNNVNDNNAHGAYDTAITEASPYSVKNTYAYNRLPNKTSNNLLTDDVAIDVWYFDSDAAKPRSGELREPVMRINPVTGKVGLAFVSGPGDFAMAGSGSANETTTNDNDSYHLWQNNYATFNNISFAYDANGYAHGTATGLDTNPGSGIKHAGRFSYFYSKWGRSGSSTGANYEGMYAMRLESIAVPETPRKQGFTINGITDVKLLIKGEVPDNDSLSETRFFSPSIVTTVNGDVTSVYLAYYDSIQSQIRFRYNSALKSTWTGNNNDAGKRAHQQNDTDQFVDNLVRKKDATADSTTPSDYDTYTGTTDMSNDSTTPTIHYEIYYESKTDYFSLIAGKDYQQGTLTTVSGKRALTGYDTGYTGYKYVAIDAIAKSKFTPAKTNDVVVAVWYDGTNCRYAYNDNPTSGLDNGTAGGWKGNKVIFTEGGEHCTIKVDPNGGVHIAAYVDGGLKYAYLENYAASEQYSESTDSVLVDSFTITGERINLDAGLVDYKKADGTTVQVVVPYIGYFNGTSRLPTVAKLVIPENGVMDYTARGTDSDDIFTGNWEISVVPSPETLTTNYYDKINIGLWKNSSGKIVKSNDTGFASATSKKTSTENTSGTDNGHIYGNGTANPILGYAIESTTGTCFETAQMK